MIPKECKRLADVDFPIATVSRHTVREKSIRHGHPSTLHLWGHGVPWRRAGQYFYALLSIRNDSTVQVLGDETLRTIARELVETVRNNVTIDWTLREDVRAKLRVFVKRTLRRYGYPPDKQEKATKTVLEQAEALSAEWVT